VLTPTYHVFEMYKIFQDATYLPLEIACETKEVGGDKHAKLRSLPLVSATAAREKESNTIALALTNVSLDKAQEVEVTLDGANGKSVSGRILTCNDVKDYNDFDHPTRIQPTTFQSVKLKKNVLTVKIPAKSVVVLEIK